MDADCLSRFVEELRSQFPNGETERLTRRFWSLRIPEWDQLRELSASGVEMGRHGVTHELHHEAQPEPVRMRELKDSKALLERRIGRACDAFAFPNGTWQPASREDLRRAGYERGFTTRPAPVDNNANFYLLPRFDPPSSMVSFTRNFFWRT